MTPHPESNLDRLYHNIKDDMAPYGAMSGHSTRVFAHHFGTTQIGPALASFGPLWTK